MILRLFPLCSKAGGTLCALESRSKWNSRSKGPMENSGGFSPEEIPYETARGACCAGGRNPAPNASSASQRTADRIVKRRSQRTKAIDVLAAHQRAVRAERDADAPIEIEPPRAAREPEVTEAPRPEARS